MRSGCLSARIVNGCIWAPAGNAEATWKQEHFARMITARWVSGCGDITFLLIQTTFISYSCYFITLLGLFCSPPHEIRHPAHSGCPGSHALLLILIADASQGIHRDIHAVTYLAQKECSPGRYALFAIRGKYMTGGNISRSQLLRLYCLLYRMCRGSNLIKAFLIPVIQRPKQRHWQMNRPHPQLLCCLRIIMKHAGDSLLLTNLEHLLCQHLILILRQIFLPQNDLFRMEPCHITELLQKISRHQMTVCNTDLWYLTHKYNRLIPAAIPLTPYPDTSGQSFCHPQSQTARLRYPPHFLLYIFLHDHQCR